MASPSSLLARKALVSVHRYSGESALVFISIAIILLAAEFLGTTRSRAGNEFLAIVVMIGAIISSLAFAYYRGRRSFRQVAEKLRFAEQQFAKVLNCNISDYQGKSNLIELTLNHMNQGVAVIRPDGRFWLYNKRALEYGGIEDPPFPPTTRAVFAEQMRNEEFGPNGELLPEEVRAFLLEGKGRPPKSYIRRRPNGTVLEIRSDPMPDGSLIQTYTDITELAEAKEAAEAAARAKTNFLAVMSHEIRTPLNGVIGAAQAMRAAPLSAEQARYLDTISSCSDALLTLVNDILDFSRFEAAGVGLHELPCDPAQVLRSAFHVTKAAGEAKGLEMALEGFDDLPPVILADAARLRQALINLLGNAVKFTSAGAVALIAQTSGAGHARRLRLSVRDTGIGVGAEALGRVFEKFEQESASIQSIYGGAGLGLAITRTIIEAMDGCVGATSRQGEGSTFWIEIPLVEADDGGALAQAAAEAALAPADCPPQRILVAEDVATNQMVIEATLKALGHSVAIVGDGAAAVARAQAEEFDLIMLDMRMPRMDGLEAARRLRALGGAFATIPVVALTANAFAEDRAACAAAGMNGFLSKPFNHREMACLIARLANGAADDQPACGDASEIVALCEAECARLLHALSLAAVQDDSHNCARALHGLRALMETVAPGGALEQTCGALLAQAMAGRALSPLEAQGLDSAAQEALKALREEDCSTRKSAA